MTIRRQLKKAQADLRKAERQRAGAAEIAIHRRLVEGLQAAALDCIHPKFDATKHCVECGMDAITATMSRASRRHL